MRATLLLVAHAAVCAGLEAKWTPNGEAPAPFSQKARQEMGMDPQAFAGQAGAPIAMKGATTKLNMNMLMVMYLSNNWKLVLALQEFLLKLLKPFIDSMGARREQQEKAAAAASEAAARKARLKRLKAQAKAKASAAVDEDDE